MHRDSIRIYSYLTNMLQEYSISDLFPELSKQVSCQIYQFQKIEISHWVCPYKCNFYSIIWFTEKYVPGTADFSTHTILPNRIFLISPEQIHNRSYHFNAAGYIFMFDKATAARLGIDFMLPYVDVPVIHIPLLLLVIENAIRKGADSDIEIDLLYFYSLIVDEIGSGNSDHKAMNILLGNFKKLILANDLKAQSLYQYADSLHIPLDSLNDTCHSLAGNSAKQFLMDVKISEAKRLLIYSRLNVSDIAYRLGFEDASYFSRIFKKKTTLSPSSFLEKYRK